MVLQTGRIYLIMKKQYEMLNALVEDGLADKIRLKYQTNLTETKAGKHNLLKYIPQKKKVVRFYLTVIIQWKIKY